LRFTANLTRFLHWGKLRSSISVFRSIPHIRPAAHERFLAERRCRLERQPAGRQAKKVWKDEAVDLDHAVD